VISILIIGNEILTAQVADFNLGYMLPRLAAAGYQVDEVRIVRDDLDVIVATIRQLSQRSRYVISTGGIGPTHDDVTLKAYAEAFSVSLESHPQMEAIITSHYGDRLTEAHLRHAILPSNIELIPGADPRWPVLKVANCFVLPGLPEAFLKKFPGVLSALPSLPTWQFAAVMTHCEEAVFAKGLTLIQNQHPHLEIGSYPNWHRDDYRAKITLKGRQHGDLVIGYQKVLALLTELGSLAAQIDPQPYDPQRHGDRFPG